MKYLQSALLGFTAVIIFFTYQSESKAQCPSGYSQTVRTMTVNGCAYSVTICYKCSILGNIYETYVVGFSQIQPDLCEQTWSFDQVLNYLTNTVNTHSFFISVLCPGVTFVPPCEDENVFSITHLDWLCWRVKRTMYGDQLHFVYEKCPEADAYCLRKVRYCRDNSGNIYTTYLQGPEIINGPIDCAIESSEIVIPAEFDVWSDCFIFHSFCNPS